MAINPNRLQQTRESAPSTNWLGDLVACLVLAPIVVAPWLFGGMTSSLRYGLMLAVAVAFLLTSLVALARPRVFAARNVPGTPVAVVPLALAFALGVIQCVPLSGSLVESISPMAAEIQTTLGTPIGPTIEASPSGSTEDPAPETMTLSVYPGSTRSDMSLLWLGIAVFAASAIVFDRRRYVAWLLIATAFNGAALACYGFVQEITTRGDTVLGFELARGNPFATFVNQNHAGAYLNLCLACALGTVILAWNRLSARSFVDIDSDVAIGPGSSLLDTISRLNGLTLTTLSLVALIAAGIVCSLSRGAFIGMCVAAAVTAVVCQPRKGPTRFEIGVVIVTLGIGIVVWVGLADKAIDRLGTLLDRDAMTEHSLLHHWPIASRVIPDYPLLGAGLGTYGYVYGMYDPGPVSAWFYRAENQYLEAMVVGGLCGVAVLAVTLALICKAVWSLARHRHSIGDLALATAGVFAFAAQLVTAVFDFGLYAPANLMLLAAICGAVVARAARLTESSRLARWSLLLPGRAVLLATAVLVVVAGVFALREAASASAAESAELEFAWQLEPSQHTLAAVDESIQRFTQVAERRPGDADVYHRLGELYILRYRLAAMDELTEQAPSDVPHDFLWDLTSISRLHGRLHELQASDPQQYDLLRSSPLVTGYLTPAIGSLEQARAACPLLPRVHLRLAELAGIVNAPQLDQVHAARAERIAPGDPAVWYRSGLLAAQGDRSDAAIEAFHRSLTLSDRNLEQIFMLVMGTLPPEVIAAKVFPASPELLLEAALRLSGEESAHPELREQLLTRGLFLVADEAESPDADRLYLEAQIHTARNDMPAAIAALRKATELRPLELKWSYEFATHLLEQGEVDEALDHARRCARLAPRIRRYRKLLERARKIQADSSRHNISEGV